MDNFLKKKNVRNCEISFWVVKNYAALNQLNFEIDKASITSKAIDPRMRLRVYWIFRNSANTYLEEAVIATYNTKLYVRLLSQITQNFHVCT